MERWSQAQTPAITGITRAESVLRVKSWVAGGTEATLHDWEAMPTQDSIDESGRPLHARTQTGCFVCGQSNPHGLQIRFDNQGPDETIATWTPAPAWEGFRGIVHGGVVSTVLDEAMSKAVAGMGIEALTAELRVRFRRHVTSGEAFLIRGWIVSRNKRMIKAEAVLAAPDGTEHAHAWATFLPLHAGELAVTPRPQ